MKNPLEAERAKSQVRTLLANQLGVEDADIRDEDSLREDLHMSPTDIVDFTSILEARGFETEKLDFSEMETFEDLVDALNL